jgi:hypothetical protein
MLVLIIGYLVTKTNCLSCQQCSEVFYVHDLGKKNWFVVMPGKKRLLGLKMLLRRNTTSLTKFHPLTLHTSPDPWDLTKHRTHNATIVKKIDKQKSRKKKQA